jgi:hypothetical protein
VTRELSAFLSSFLPHFVLLGFSAELYGDAGNASVSAEVDRCFAGHPAALAALTTNRRDESPRGAATKARRHAAAPLAPLVLLRSRTTIMTISVYENAWEWLSAFPAREFRSRYLRRAFYHKFYEARL